MAKADTGTSQHYFKSSDTAIIQHIKAGKNESVIQLPDSSTVRATHVGTLPLNKSLTPRAKKVQILTKLMNTLLLSIGKFCDDNCVALFSKYALKVFKNNELVIQGICNQ